MDDETTMMRDLSISSSLGRSRYFLCLLQLILTDFNGGCHYLAILLCHAQLHRIKHDQSKCRIAGYLPLMEFERIEVPGDTIRTFRIVHYITGIRQGPLGHLHPPLNGVH